MNGVLTKKQEEKRSRIGADGVWELLKKREAQRAMTEDRNFVYDIPTEAILPNRAQPRRVFEEDAIIKLADSIRQYGILQPLTVRRIEDDGEDGGSNGKKNKCSLEKSGRYELIAGERRLRAAKLLRMPTVPCLILEADSRRSAEIAIIENLQREDLNMFEEASAIAALMGIYRMTQEQIAACLSLSQSCVANKLRILRLSEEERRIILVYGLTERHARALLKLGDGERRLRALETIAERKMNVSAAEKYIEELLSPPLQPITVPQKSKRRFVIKDMRLFYNSIDRAIDTVRRAGIEVSSEKKEADGLIELVITIPSKQVVKSAGREKNI